jgi:hypothetical protein
MKKVYVLKNRHNISGNVMYAGRHFRYATREEADSVCARINAAPVNKKLTHFVVEEEGVVNLPPRCKHSERLADDVYAKSRARGEDDALTHGL